MGARAGRCFESQQEPVQARPVYQQPSQGYPYQQPYQGQPFQQPLGPDAHQAMASAPPPPSYDRPAPAVAHAVPVAAPAHASMASAAPAGSVPLHVASDFVRALEAEYLRRCHGSVGVFLVRPEVQPFVNIFTIEEDRVRTSPDPARTIQEISARFGLSRQSSQPVYAQQASPVYAQRAAPAYAQPAPMGPGYAAPHYRHDYRSSGGGDAMLAGGVGLAAGLAGGMLIENALDHRHHHHHGRDFAFGGGPFGGSDVIYEETRPHGFLGFGSEQVIDDVRTDAWGDTRETREIIDRDMFGNVTEVREEVIDRDMFGRVEDVREYDSYNDW